MGVFLPAQSSDDCRTWPAWSAFYSLTSLHLPLGSVVTVDYVIGIRFTGINIPQGTTIISAKLTFNSYDGQSSTPTNVQIKGQAADDPHTFYPLGDDDYGFTEFNARVRTSAAVNWLNIPEWFVDTDYDSPDITSIIQEIINRAGWVSGNSLVIFIASTETYGYAFRRAKSFDDSPTLCPRLTIITGGAYQIDPDGGSYVLTGSDLALSVSTSLGGGSYAISGQDVTLLRNSKIEIESGSFTITGSDVSLYYGHLCDIGAESFLISGKDVDLSYVPVGQPTILIEGGYFTVVGQDVSLYYGHKVDIGVGTYALTGHDVDLLYTRYKITIGSGSFIVTGSDITLTKGGTGFTGWNNLIRLFLAWLRSLYGGVWTNTPTNITNWKRS